jgi:sec-independent protein translocase protein TatC
MRLRAPRPPRKLAHGEEATLVEHLEELRWRIFIVLGSLVVMTIVAYVFHTHIIDWLNQPLPAGRRRTYTFGVAEPFTVSLRVSAYAGFVLSLPITIWQVWAFFAPALDPRLERHTLAMAGVAGLLGVAGLAFGYYLLLPSAIHWLTNYDNHQFVQLVQARPYYTFVSTVLLGIVVIFELPLVVVGLVHLGVLSSRSLRRQRRLGYFITAVIAMALPGPDPVTTGLELLAMWALFESSIWASVVFERRAARASTAPAGT